MEILIGLALILTTSLAMRIKGGFRYKGKEVPNGRAISTVLFGLVLSLVCLDGYQGIVFAAAWFLGCVPELGDKLGDLKEDFLKGFIPMSLRGLWFGVPLSVASMSVLPILLSMTMPFCYALGFQLETKYPKVFKSGTNFGGWAMGEWLFGAALGLSLITLINV